jgi:glutamine amidotransferase/cyclase
MAKLKVSLLDYGAGNVRSVRNAITANGYEIEDITDPSQIEDAKVIIFPGVGSYRSAMKVLNEKGYVEPLRKYLSDGTRPYLGICLGMQTLFESSEEAPEGMETMEGLGIIPGKVVKFDESEMTVPHIGWNGRSDHQESPVFKYVDKKAEVYFVHSYYAEIDKENEDWVLTSTTYDEKRFISSIQKGAIVACQFHPEKSGQTGLNFIKGFLEVSTRLQHHEKQIIISLSYCNISHQCSPLRMKRL